jgi:endonuclease/exonuclease/phosphatase family metal-dependent hydrolase
MSYPVQPRDQEVKVAVYTAHLTAAESQRQFQAQLVAVGLIGLSLLAAIGAI